MAAADQEDLSLPSRSGLPTHRSGTAYEKIAELSFPPESRSWGVVGGTGLKSDWTTNTLDLIDFDLGAAHRTR